MQKLSNVDKFLTKTFLKIKMNIKKECFKYNCFFPCVSCSLTFLLINSVEYKQIDIVKNEQIVIEINDNEMHNKKRFSLVPM